MTADHEWDAIVAGDLFVDLIFSGFPSWPQPGEEAFAQRFAREVGGGAAITACGLAKLGLKSALFAVTGKVDSFGLIERLNGCGVDTRAIQFHSSEPAGLTVSVSTAKDRAFFTYAGANPALLDLLLDANVRLDLARARHVHLACAPAPELLMDLSGMLHERGCRVSLDVGWHEDWLKDRRSLRALREIDLFMPNEREARLMTGESEPEAILRAFAEAGLRAVALKLGPRGAALLWDEQIHRCEPYPARPLDTTGAGDGFDAGFIFGCLRGDAPAACLQAANVCGALSTEALGGLAAFPERDRLETALLRYGE